MSPLSKKIDAIIEEKSLLKHPFYQMWSDGKLSMSSLAGYS
ncbi:MAG: pyrroloquinoline quinone biosynthesis protein PqqC, partial [Candidatus Nitrosotenuis sp.]